MTKLRQQPLTLATLVSAALAINIIDSWPYVIRLRQVRGVAWAVLPLLLCAACALVSAIPPPANSAALGWRRLSFAWFLAGAAVWMSIAYFLDNASLFYLLVVLLGGALLGAPRLLRLSSLPRLCLNTLVLLLIALPLLDVALYDHAASAPSASGEHAAAAPRRGSPHFIDARNAHQFYSFAAARGDPSQFAVWWRSFYSELYRLLRDIGEPAPGFIPSIRLRPNSAGQFFASVVKVNSRGFRGQEIPTDKGDAYRIVALGESTTFGMTMASDDQPWPALLEQIIRDRLHPSRRVEVINAGVPGYDLADNVRRLETDILPLHPDLIISYHGYNGFLMIDGSFPHPWEPPPPPFPDRPLKLAAELEYRLTLRSFLRDQIPSAPRAPRAIDPLQTRYADAYRRLIVFSRMNDIRLALANFSMAIDEQSSSQLLDFYGSCGWGVLCVRRRANAIHTEIVRQLAAQNPGVLYIDTHSNLNARPENFIDIVHLTQTGRRQLAENIFRALRPTLQRDLSPAPSAISSRRPKNTLAHRPADSIPAKPS